MAATQQPTIALVVHSLVVGGTEVLAARLVRGLGGQFRFVVACLDELGSLGDALRADGVEVRVLGRRPGFDWRCARRLSLFFREQHVDIVHAHQYTPCFYSLSAGFFRRRPPVLFTEHGRWHPDYPRRKRIVFNRLCLRRRDRVIGVGHHVRQALIDNEGIPDARVGVIHNGVDLAPYADSQCSRDDVRSELQIPADAAVLIQVARLDDLKDHATAMRTMQRVVASRPEAILLLVGDGPLRAEIETAVSRLRLQHNVRLLGERGDVARLLAAADLFLLSSKSEGIPLTLIEAMAARLPIVSTDVGGIAEIVEHGETGLLCQAGDDTALAQAALELLGDVARRATMGNRGREVAFARFSETQNHAAYAALYREMYRG